MANPCIEFGNSRYRSVPVSIEVQRRMICSTQVDGFS